MFSRTESELLRDTGMHLLRLRRLLMEGRIPSPAEMQNLTALHRGLGELMYNYQKKVISSVAFRILKPLVLLTYNRRVPVLISRMYFKDKEKRKESIRYLRGVLKRG
jgi:histone deacetylase complex regulatory component SIN3